MSFIEVYKPYPTNKTYEISNLGNVRRNKGKNIYKKLKNIYHKTTGYTYFNLYISKTNRKQIFLHRAVAKLFIGEPPQSNKRLEVDHIDRNKINNSFENLRYVTRQQNAHNSSMYHSDIHIDTADVPARRKALRAKRMKTPELIVKRRKIGTVRKIADNKYMTVIRHNGVKYRKVINDTYDKADFYVLMTKQFLNKYM